MLQPTTSRGRKAGLSLVLLLVTVLALPGCAVRFIADYDARTEEAIHEMAREIDGFYLRLQDLPEADRAYDPFAEDYQRIEAQARALVRRNRVRELNQDSTRIAELFLELWQDSRAAHRSSGTYGDFDLEEDWTELQNVLSYALQAEGAKPPPGA